MKKKIIVVAIATTLATPVVVRAEATMYGQVRVASQYHSRENYNDSWGMQDHSSRFGLKGEEDLGGGLKGIFQLEFGVDVGTGFGGKDASNGNFIGQRNSYVGLGGGFGTILAGRHDTPFKLSTMKLDFFQDTNVDSDTNFGGDITDTRRLNAMGVGLLDGLRVDGAIAYISPNLAGLTLMGAVVQTAAFDNSFDDSDSGAGAYSLAATYSNGPWFASAGYETLSPDNLGVSNNAEDYDKWRLGVGILDFNNISASFVYEERTNTFFIDGADTSSWQASLAYDLMGGLKLKGMFGKYDGANDMGDPDFTTWAAGLQYNLSKRTDAQLLYRQKVLDDGDGSDDNTDNVVALQLDHAF